MKFKVGDKVKWNGNTSPHEGVSFDSEKKEFLESKIEHRINFIDRTDDTCQLGGAGVMWFNLCWFEKVERLEVTTDYRNPKWCLVSDDGKEWEKRILINDNNELNFKFPYFVVPEHLEKDFLNGKEIPMPTYFIFAKPCPEYKAYSKPKLEWIGKYIKRKSDGLVFEITSICKEKTIRISDTSEELGKRFTMQEFLNECTWLDGSPCGIKQ